MMIPNLLAAAESSGHSAKQVAEAIWYVDSVRTASQLDWHGWRELKALGTAANLFRTGIAIERQCWK